MPTVAFHTLGCKVNSYESEAMLENLKQHGYLNVNFDEVADVYVINTCTVTNTGDAKSRQMIRKAKRQHPDAIICVIGCYAQVAAQEVASIEGVSVVIGTNHRDRLFDYIETYKQTHQQIIDVSEVMSLKSFETLPIDTFENKTRAFMKIQDGCNNFCTYCIIPYARGGMRSRPKEDVIAQAERLVDQGYCEIVLTGIHTAGYGEDLENYSFYDLLCELVEIPGLKRLRISSIEMSQVSDDIIALIGRNHVIVDHLHIPIQSGNDKILKLMGRHYTTAEFEEKLNALKAALPELSVTTDVIVGFPKETDEDFESTYRWIEKNHFNQLHVFPYSPRKNTPAAKFKQQVPGDVKKARVRRLIELSDRLKTEYAEQFIGRSLDILFEEYKDGYWVGHASNYLKVKVNDEHINSNDLIKVLITQCDGTDLIGVIK